MTKKSIKTTQSHTNNCDTSPSWLFVLSVLLIYPLPQLALDIYLPSWPSMVSALHTSHQMLQFTLTIYVFFLGAAQLIYGPLSDRFGRKPILLSGISFFFLGSLGCMFSTTIQQLIIFRIIQALGIGCGFTVASSTLADVFRGKLLARITSYSAMVYSLSLILAPLLGGYLQHYIGWHANFMVQAAYAMLLFILIYCFVKETNTNNNRVALSFSRIIKKYCSILKNLSFVYTVICLVFSYGTMIAVNVIGPFLYQNTFHISAINYGQLLLIIGISYFLGATTNNVSLKHYNMNLMIIFGLILMTLSGIGLLSANVLHHFNASLVTGFICLALFALGFIYPNCFAYALDLFSEKGFASALIGSIILIGVSMISAVISHLNISHSDCLILSFCLLAILSIICYSITYLTREISS